MGRRSGCRWRGCPAGPFATAGRHDLNSDCKAASPHFVYIFNNRIDRSFTDFWWSWRERRQQRERHTTQGGSSSWWSAGMGSEQPHEPRVRGGLGEERRKRRIAGVRWRWWWI